MSLLYKGSKAEYINFSLPDRFIMKLKEKKDFHYSPSEIESFKTSYYAISSILLKANVPDDITVVAEYGIEVGSYRIDYILTGYDERDKARAIIIELKQWSVDGIKESRYSDDLVFVKAYSSDVVHPCYQAWSYQIMLENYNSNVQSDPIGLSSCAYLFNYEKDKAGKDDLLRKESFSVELQKAQLYEWGEDNELAAMISKTLIKGDGFKVFDRINTSEVRPSEALQNAVSDMMRGNSAFVLVDEQKKLFEKAVHYIRMGMIDGKKRIYIINGGPGTGKSVLAINLMTYMLTNGIDSTNFRVSKSELKTYISKNISNPKKKNHIAVYCPYVTKTTAPRDVYEAMLRFHSASGKKWTKADVNGLFIGAGKFRSKPEKPVFAGVVVDEAHRMKDKDRFSNNTCYLENVMTSAYSSIFFVDDKQRISTEDFGTTQKIREIAEKNGYEILSDELSVQFRCGGSAEYISFIDNVLYSNVAPNHLLLDNYDFQVFDDPEEMHQAIIEKDKVRKADALPSRVSAGYCWDWISDKDDSAYDIVIPRKDGKSQYKRKWNLKSGKTPFALHEESIERVGCIHTTQGLEFEYAGVIIGYDLYMQDGKLITDKNKRASTDNSINNRKTMDRASIEEIILNTYRVLLTRGQKGCYVYCCDNQLSSFLKECIKSSGHSFN